MANNGSRIYIDTSVTPNVGIDIQKDISYVVRGNYNVGDLGQLCKDVDENGVAFNPMKINIWSKVKPTEVSGKPGNLTDNDRFGTNTDHSAGIYWGIQINVPSTPNIGNIHTSAFTWAKRPTTWFRDMDFNGYDHNAVPNPAGNVISPAAGYVDVSTNGNRKFEGLYGYYLPNNTTGVDLSMALFDSQSIDLTKVYPCIVIKTEISPGVFKNYFTALTDSVTGTPRPLKESGNVYPSNPLYADLNKKVFSNDPISVPEVPPVFAPSSGAERINTVSLCLMELTKSGNAILLDPGSPRQDMATYWFDASMAGLIATTKVVPLPGLSGGCTGLSISFRDAQNGVDVSNTSATLGSTGAALNFAVTDYSMATLSSYNVILDITFKMGANTVQIQRNTTASEILSNWTVRGYIVEWQGDLGLIGTPASQFTLSVQVRCGSYNHKFTYENVNYAPGTIYPTQDF